MDDRTSDRKKYLHYCLERMGFKLTTQTHQSGISFYGELVDHYQMSLREIEQSLCNFAMVNNMRGSGMSLVYLFLVVYLSVIKVLYPKIIDQIYSKQIDYPELLEATALESLQWVQWKDRLENHPVKWLLRHQLSSDADREEMLKREPNFQGENGIGFGDSLMIVAGWLRCFA